MTDESGPDLSLVGNDELVAELRRRHDGILVVMERDGVVGGTGTSMEWWGGLSRCIGLAERVKARMLACAGEDEAADPEDG